MKRIILSLLAFSTLAATPYRSVTKPPLVFNHPRVLKHSENVLELDGHRIVGNEIQAGQLLISGAVTTLGAAWMAYAVDNMKFNHNSPMDYALNGMVGYALPLTVIAHGIMYSLQALGVDIMPQFQTTIGGAHIAVGFGAWAFLTAGYFFKKEPGKIIGTFLTAAPFVALGAYDLQAANGSVLSIRF